ncbi:hypothetical protein [Modestobacter sp. SSW1-42]|uniref:hypothetical protein n=1 Tax=Modestobacter sp. SSW1-42 TaxID=596372 RepID=UPI003985DC93
MDQERTGASVIGRWVGWLVVLTLTAAVVVGTVTVVGQVAERPLTRAAVTPSSAPPSSATAVPAVAGQPLPEVIGRPVAEAQPALQQTGAVVELVDAGGASRPVQPGWVVCTAGASTGTDASAVTVQVAAVPAGDACS